MLSITFNFISTKLCQTLFGLSDTTGHILDAQNKHDVSRVAHRHSSKFKYFDTEKLKF